MQPLKIINPNTITHNYLINFGGSHVSLIRNRRKEISIQCHSRIAVCGSCPPGDTFTDKRILGGRLPRSASPIRA